MAHVGAEGVFVEVGLDRGWLTCCLLCILLKTLCRSRMRALMLLTKRLTKPGKGEDGRGLFEVGVLFLI